MNNYSKEDKYINPTGSKVLQKLEWFKDQKLVLMIHWVSCYQLGIVTSGALSDNFYWSRNQIDWGVTGEEFKK